MTAISQSTQIRRLGLLAERAGRDDSRCRPPLSEPQRCCAMSSASAFVRAAVFMSHLLRQPNLGVLVALTWLVVAFTLLVQYWPETGERLRDTDDAMRLVQLRAWLAGQSLLDGWFDLHEPRLNPPLGHETHWSRLVDAGLAGLYLLFKWFASPLAAERLMRAAWPLLWLLP